MNWEDRLAAHLAKGKEVAPKAKSKKAAPAPETSDSWSEKALAYIKTLAVGREITSEDLDIACGIPRKANQRGQVFHTAAHLNLIVDTGNTVRSPSPLARGRRIRVWRRL